MSAQELVEKYLKDANELAGRGRFNAAFSKFELATRRNHSKAKAHTDWGFALLTAGRIPEGVEQLRKGAEIDPDNPLDVNRLSEGLRRDIRQEEDIKEFQKIIDVGDRADLFHAWAGVLSNLQRGDAAIEQFRKALAKDPELGLEIDSLVQAFNHSKTPEQHVKEFEEDLDKLNNAVAWKRWGTTLSALGRFADAITQFEKAVNLKNDWAEPHLNWGAALVLLGDYEQAVKVFGKALACDKQSVQAYWVIGRALYEIGEHQQAIANYQRGAAAAPSDIYFSPWLECLKKLPDPDSAIAEYQQALDMGNFDRSWIPHLELGQFLMERDRTPESAIRFVQAWLYGNHPDAASQLEEVLTNLAERQIVLEAIQKMVDIANTSERYLEWGQILTRINEPDRAQQQLSKALELLSGVGSWPFPALKDLVLAFNTPEVRQVAQSRIQEALSRLNNAGLVLKWAEVLVEDFNDIKQALELYRKVLLTAPSTYGLVEDFSTVLPRLPDPASVTKEIQAAVNNVANADVFQHWALIVINLGKQKQAIENLERSIQLAPGNGKAHYQLAGLFDQQGNYAKAGREFQKACELSRLSRTPLFKWGTSLLKAGRREEAIQKYLELVREPWLFFAFSEDFINQARPGRVLQEDQAADRGHTGFRALGNLLKWDDDLVARFQEAFDVAHNVDAYNQWGLLLSDIGKYEQAINQFKQAIDLDPDAPESYSNWLKVLGAGGLSSERIAEYEEAIDKYRNNGDAYNELGNWLYDLNWNERAAEKYQKALERDPKNTFARASWIDCLIGANNLTRAREQAQQLLAEDPSNGSAYNCLAWGAFLDGDYEEVIKQCELGIENVTSQVPRYLYTRCANAWYKLGREDLARKKLEGLIEQEPDNVYANYSYGVLLMDMNYPDEATAVFQKVITLKADHSYANHNLAAIPYDQGRYEEAFGKWIDAIRVYEQQASMLTRVVENHEFVDSNESFYHASLVLTILQKHDEAETILEQGLAFDPYNPIILRLLVELNWERKDELIRLDADTSRQRSECYWRGMNYFQRAEKLLKDRSDRYPNYYILIELGDLYLTREDFDKARPCFEQARLKDDSAYLPYARLGVISLRERQPEKAIPLLLEALKRNPDVLDVKSSLAEAYLRAEKLDEAETSYRQVLNITYNHVQSSIGLGELCTALGDKKDTDRYAEAIEHFTRALDVAKNEKIRSKYLKNQEKAGVYYQLGYARVQSYETLGIRRDTKLLEQAQKDFNTCVDLNPSHQKAKRAKEKIDKRLGYFSRDRLTETTGPRAIFWMSITIFAFVQLAFYVAPVFNRPKLVVSDKSLQAVAKQVSPETLASLEALKNQKFDSQEALSNALNQLVKTDVETVTTAVLQNASMVKPVEDFPEMPAGYYALLTFGSLLFMVVGLYLPQILKLRVAGIELEKSSVDQAATGGTLGISK